MTRDVRAGRFDLRASAEALLSGKPGAEPVALHAERSPTPRRLHFVRAADVTPSPVSWTWDARVPAGKLVIWEARMGTGKTSTAMKLAAAVSTGGPLPGQSSTPSGCVAIISSEDSASDTLVPRLIAAGADLARVRIFDGFTRAGSDVEAGGFSLAADMARLRQAIEEHGITLLVLDPITAMLGETNSYKDADVRGLLAPLAAVAENTDCAVVAIRHLRKGGGAAEDAGSGSIAFGAAARSVIRFDRDPEDESAYLLSVVKASLAERPPTIRYKLVGVELPGGIATSRVEWCGTSALSAHDLADLASAPEDNSTGQRAAELIREALADGPRPQSEIMAAAKAEDIAPRTLQRTAKALGVVTRRTGFGRPSEWSLASVAPSSPQSRPVAPYPENGATEGSVARLAASRLIRALEELRQSTPEEAPLFRSIVAAAPLGALERRDTNALADRLEAGEDIGHDGLKLAQRLQR
jgi:putative DNA primase/helicase